MNNVKAFIQLQIKVDNVYRSQGTAPLILETDNIKITVGWKPMAILYTAFSPVLVCSFYLYWQSPSDTIYGGLQELRSLTS